MRAQLQEEEEEELSQSSVLLLQDKRTGRQAGVWDLGVTPQRRKEGDENGSNTYSKRLRVETAWLKCSTEQRRDVTSG